MKIGKPFLFVRPALGNNSAVEARNTLDSEEVSLVLPLTFFSLIQTR